MRGLLVGVYSLLSSQEQRQSGRGRKVQRAECKIYRALPAPCLHSALAACVVRVTSFYCYLHIFCFAR